MTKSEKQLVSSMERVAGDLAWRAVKAKEIFSIIKIYGLLINAKDETAIVAELVMNFIKMESTLRWCDKAQDVTDCIHKLRHVLSGT